MIDMTIPISEIMTTDLITIHPKEPMTEVERIFKKYDIHHIPVVDEDYSVVGMISKSDYLRTLHGLTLFKVAKAEMYNEAMLRSMLVGEVMTRQIAQVRPESPLSLAADIFMENLFHALPVVDNKRLVGIITTFDLLKYAYK
jgi:CBS domain-containing protein